MAVVKADAYGHGAVPVARTFLEEGATRLAVAVLGEALELRSAGITCPILVLGWTPPADAPAAVEYDVSLTLYSLEEARKIAAMAEAVGGAVKYHIKVDTGMGRIGLPATEPESIDEAVAMAELPRMNLEGCFTHFAAADGEDPSFTMLQLERYLEFIQALEERGVKLKTRHTANSAATINFPETHLDMVRPGIAQYGYYPSPYVDRTVEVAPALSFKTRIAHLKWVDSGAPISYNCTWHAPERRQIATLPVGYADGFNRLLSNGGEVLVHEKRCKIVGRVCMDQTMVDVTQVPEVQAGDEVVLMGAQGTGEITADERADELRTISHEVLCDIARRVPRVYVERN
jgi:alanine racemase